MTRQLLPAAMALLTLAATGVRADDLDGTVKALEDLGGFVLRDEDAPGRPVVLVNFRL